MSEANGDHSTALTAAVQEIFTGAGLSTTFRALDPNGWAAVMAALAYMPVLYSHHSLEYQLAYHALAGGRWTDLSLVLRHDNRTVGIWPLTLAEFDGETKVSSQGLPILPPLFATGTPAAIRKNLTGRILNALEQLCAAYGVKHWTSQIPFEGVSTSPLSEWHHQIMTRGGRVQVLADLFVDLSLEIEDIRKHFRKSYKPLINLGLRSWVVEIVSRRDEAAWQAFKALHKKAAGRSTRSDHTWDLQLAAIAAGEAFMVSLKDHSGEMVGAGFFAVTPHEASYSVGAYNRDLFDKPLGHVVQQAAIEEMQRRGLRWYHIGRRPYLNEAPAPTQKEVSIGEFKQGFATAIMPRYVLRRDRA